MRNVYDIMDEALSLVPLTYPKREELVAEIYEFKNQSPEGDPTLSEVTDCFEYYLGSLITVAWKKKISEILKG